MPRRDKRILTKIQQQTLDAIRAHILKHGESPTLEELRKELRVDSHQTISDRVTALVKKGFVRRKPHSWRNLELTERSLQSGKKIVQVPLQASVGADNMSVFAQEEYGQFVHVDQSLLQGYRDVVAIRAIGHSMRDADIYDGSYVLVEVYDGYQPKNADLVAAVIGDMAVVKRYYATPRSIELRPESTNPVYTPIIVSRGSDEVKIIGRVIDILSTNEDPDDDLTVEYIKE